jgi:hypothetical protein
MLMQKKAGVIDRTASMDVCMYVCMYVSIYVTLSFLQYKSSGLSVCTMHFGASPVAAAATTGTTDDDDDEDEGEGEDEDEDDIARN